MKINSFHFILHKRRHIAVSASCLMLLLSAFALIALAQDEVTGAFEGMVVDVSNNKPIKDATVRVTNEQTGVPVAKRADDKGHFYVGLLPPGVYIIRISAPGFKTKELKQRLLATTITRVMPYPTTLELEEKAKQ